MQSLEGYQNPKIIYESDRSLVFRALEEKNKRPVILKAFNKQYPTPEEISRFNREYKINRIFKNDGIIVKVYEMSKVKDSPAIIMEDIGAQSLAEILKTKKLNLDEFLIIVNKIINDIFFKKQRKMAGLGACDKICA